MNHHYQVKLNKTYCMYKEKLLPILNLYRSEINRVNYELEVIQLDYEWSNSIGKISLLKNEMKTQK